MHKHDHVTNQAISNIPETYMIDIKIEKRSVLVLVLLLDEELLDEELLDEELLDGELLDVVVYNVFAITEAYEELPVGIISTQTELYKY